MTLNEFLKQFAEALNNEARGSWFADYYEDDLGRAKRQAKEEVLSDIASIVERFVQEDD